MVGRNKNNSFQSLKDKVWKRIQRWKEKLLSKGRKEILIKAVAQAIPTYTMNVFKIPTTLCYDLSQMFAKFWWGINVDVKKIHQTAWDKLYWLKSYEGMSLKDLHTFNLAMLAKQGCRIPKTKIHWYLGC